MIVARTMLMEDDPEAMDRLIKLTGERDRYPGFGKPLVSLLSECSRRRRRACPGRRRFAGAEFAAV
jgi:hypothetical protein